MGLYSKTMPANVTGPSDRNSTFVLGRLAFNKKIHESHLPNNVRKNINYDNVKNNITSNVYAKPLENIDSNLRTQRLRLSAIGNGSSLIKNTNDEIRYKSSSDINLVNNVLSRVRGAGYLPPKTR